jgi:DNA-binding NtrC family response regulator
MVLHENNTITASDIAFDDLGYSIPELGTAPQLGTGEDAVTPHTSAQDSRSHNMFDIRQPAQSEARSTSRESVELKSILAALRESASRTQAAEQLGMSPRTLRQKLFEFRKAGHEVPRAYARS